MKLYKILMNIIHTLYPCQPYPCSNCATFAHSPRSMKPAVFRARPSACTLPNPRYRIRSKRCRTIMGCPIVQPPGPIRRTHGRRKTSGCIGRKSAGGNPGDRTQYREDVAAGIRKFAHSAGMPYLFRLADAAHGCISPALAGCGTGSCLWLSQRSGQAPGGRRGGRGDRIGTQTQAWQ